jgi:hypothetical protein
VAELGAAGYITRERNGRRNHYTINSDKPASRASGGCFRSSLSQRRSRRVNPLISRGGTELSTRARRGTR